MKFKEKTDPIRTHKPRRHVESVTFLGKYLWGGICSRDEVVVRTQHQIYAGTTGARTLACLFGLDAEYGLLLLWHHCCFLRIQA